MSIGDPEKIVYLIVVYGLDVESSHLFRQHFTETRGGANPETLRVYDSVQCELSEIEDCVAWIATKLENHYESLSISVIVSTPLSWANVVIPPEILATTCKYSSGLKISFSTPPRPVGATQHCA